MQDRFVPARRSITSLIECGRSVGAGDEGGGRAHMTVHRMRGKGMRTMIARGGLGRGTARRRM
jgi:hypothetical protein